MPIDKKDLTQYQDILNKMVKIQGTKDTWKPYKIILCIAGCLACLCFVVMLCLLIYKNDFSVESVLSLLLAFFSIFISIFFYFKASETSSKFYDNSYNFMKDISVTLGKIEERFGEKLNSMNEKLSHIEIKKEETVAELQTAENEKDTIINDLMEKAKLTEDQKEQYRRSLQSKEEEASLLKERLRQMESELRRQRRMASSYESTARSEQFATSLPFSERDIHYLLNGRPNILPARVRDSAKQLGLLDEDDDLTAYGKKLLSDYLRTRQHSTDE